MRRRILLIAAIALCATLASRYVYYRYFASVVRVDAAYDAQWSRDGKALYYRLEDRSPGVHRYDVCSRTRQVFKGEAGLFDVSPDEKSIVLVRHGRDIYLQDLLSGVARRIYSSAGDIEVVRWLPQDRILLQYADNLMQGVNTQLIDPHTSRAVSVSCREICSFCGYDGSGYIYSRDIPGRLIREFRFFSLKDGSDKLLIRTNGVNASFLYLTNKNVIYYLHDTKGRNSPRLLNITTMKARVIGLPLLVDSISPDGVHYWFRETTSVHYGTHAINIGNLPQEVTRELL